jgi:riboflavin biosynthesis pyrimidine reductase
MLERLFPDPAEIDLGEQLDLFQPQELATPRRPYLYTNFVSSIDGHATLDNRSGKLAGETDLQMLLGLRERADAVMIGAGTLWAERYGRIIRSAERRARREERGLAGDALAVIVSNRLALPWDIPLFTEGNGEVVIFTGSDEEPAETPTPHTVVRHPGGVDLTRALEELRTEYGIRALLCEGGPTLHGNLLEEDLVDELFVTFGGKLAGGTGPGIAVGLSHGARELELRWLLRDGVDLFTRYAVAPR